MLFQRVSECLNISERHLMQPLARKVEEATGVGSICPLRMFAATMDPEFDELVIALCLAAFSCQVVDTCGDHARFAAVARMPDNVFYQALFRTDIRHELDTFQAYLEQKSGASRAVPEHKPAVPRHISGSSRAPQMTENGSDYIPLFAIANTIREQFCDRL